MAPYAIAFLRRGQLLVAERPDYLFAALFGVPAIAGMVSVIRYAVLWRSLRALLGLSFCAPFRFAAWMGLNTGSLVLDGAPNAASSHATTQFGHDDFSVPLDQAHFARVRDPGRGDRIVVVLRNGDGLRFSDANHDPGTGRAAHAVNQYVGYDQGD